METVFIPTENDIKKWIKEAISEGLENGIAKDHSVNDQEEELLSRKEIAKKLRISLVTLTDWVKRGLPSHKQRGRVHFDKTEVIKYIKENKIGQLKFSSRFETLRQEIA